MFPWSAYSGRRISVGQRPITTLKSNCSEKFRAAHANNANVRSVIFDAWWNSRWIKCITPPFIN